MTTLATLEAVKFKLGIPASTTDRDDELLGIIDGVNGYIVRRTRFALEAGDIVREVHERVRAGDAVYTKLRPIDPDIPVVAYGRSLGSQQLTLLEAEVVDPFLGKVRILGATDAARPWPPSAWPGALQGRWRRWRWPILLLDYSVVEADEIADLANAANALAAYSDTSADGTGAVQSETVGQVTVAYGAVTGSGPIPAAIDSTIEGFVYPKGRLV